MSKRYITLGCCGIDCGLCPRFYTEGSSKCPGCYGPGFEEKHPSCSFITCCVKKNGLEVCGECSDFPCPKFANETGEYDSFVTHRKVIANQKAIKQSGLSPFINQQQRRIKLLRTMLSSFDDGRCKSLYCLATALLSIENLSESLLQAEKLIGEMSVGQDGLKGKAKILREILNKHAKEENVELKLLKAKRQ